MSFLRDLYLSTPLSVDLAALLRDGVFTRLSPKTDRPAPLRVAIFLEKWVARRRPRTLAAALGARGPNWIKLGQFLATRQDIIGPKNAAELSALHDRLAPFCETEARRVIESHLGISLKATFQTFTPAVAAASIAQVHRAKLKDGEEVAIKVLRPGIRQRFLRDLERFAALARLVERLSPSARRLRPSAVAQRLSRSVRLEMDLRLEAAALSEFADRAHTDDDFRVPKVYWHLSGRDVLATAWIHDTPLSTYLKTCAARAAGDGEARTDITPDPRAVARRLMRGFLRQALVGGLFHADMHPGNLFVSDEGKLSWVDFGITERLDRQQQRFLAEILYGFLKGDYQRVAEVHAEAGYIPDPKRIADFAMACRCIAEPIRGKDSSQIPMVKLLGLLFEITEIFAMKTRPELLLLHKTMVVVEGLCRELDPAFDLWATSEPILRDWIKDQMQPDRQARQAMRELVNALRRSGGAADLMVRIERFARQASDHVNAGVRLHPEVIETLSRQQADDIRERRFSRRLLTILLIGLASALIVGALFGVPYS